MGSRLKRKALVCMCLCTQINGFHQNWKRERKHICFIFFFCCYFILLLFQVYPYHPYFLCWSIWMDASFIINNQIEETMWLFRCPKINSLQICILFDLIVAFCFCIITFSKFVRSLVCCCIVKFFNLVNMQGAISWNKHLLFKLKQ